MLLSLMWDRLGEAPEGWARHVVVQWGDIEGAQGQYGFARVENWLGASAAPVFLAFQFSTANRSRNELKDLTPTFHKRSLTLSSGALRGEIPNYGDPTWRKAIYGAVRALGQQYRNDPRVMAGFWGPGVDDEVNAVINWAGVDWYPSLRSQLASSEYYSFIEESTQMFVDAWAPKPVYLAAAPAPGTPWKERRRDVIETALATGAGYRCNGLLEDAPNAVGVGLHAGTGMYDMCDVAQFCAFEGGLNGQGQPPMRLYWMLLQALAWGATHVNLQKAWLPAAETVEPLLPTAKVWIVFRDAEYPTQTWTGKDGNEYGQGGTPGPFGRGLRLTAWPAQPVFRPDSFGFDRWELTTDAPFEVKTWLPDGRYEVVIWRPNGCQDRVVADVAQAKLLLPAGAYHRVDVASMIPPEPLTLEERVARLERLAAEHGW